MTHFKTKDTTSRGYTAYECMDDPGIMFSYYAALSMYRRHGLTEGDLLSDNGERLEYSGKELFTSLGY
jgi:hypothetical protein